MTEPSESLDPLDELGEEFLDRLRRGECPDITEFADRDPANAGQIREFLSALLMVEELKPRDDQTVDGLGMVPELQEPRLERLGDFRILRELGRGGMGIVYEAEQESLGRRVALKVLSPAVARSPQQVRRFFREARSAARLHHTNVVPVFGVGEHGGVYYYAMQFIPGLGLDKVLDEVRRLKGVTSKRENHPSSTRRIEDGSATPLDPSLSAPGAAESGEGAVSRPVVPPSPSPSPLTATKDGERGYARAVAQVGLQVADALEYAHRQGTLHRDVKPSNILLDLHGVAWVTDFGLAKAAEDEDLTRTGDLVGTIRYMAPERFRGLCNAASDVYGLGLALYELMALRPAFDAPDRDRLLYQVGRVDPPRLRAINPALPRDLETIVHKAIEKDPAHRYGAAAELAEDLRCFLEDRPIRARRVGSTERLTRWARRNPGMATLGTALAGMLALVVLVIAAADLRLRRQNEQTSFQLQRAERAEGDAVNKLIASHIQHARASRRSRFEGRRFEGLRAIAEAASLDRTGVAKLELRDEAIACMALTDLRMLEPWPGRFGDGFVGVDFDPVTGRMARGTSDGSVEIRGVEGNRERELLRIPGDGRRALFVRFSPDGRHLAVKQQAHERVHLTVWNLVRVEKVLDVPEGMYSDALDFHPNGELLAAGRRDASIVVHDLSGRREPRRLSPGTVPGTLRFDPSGERIAVVSPSSRQGLQVRRLDDGAIVPGWDAGGPAYAVAWHPSGRRLAVGTVDGKVLIHDAESPSRPPRSFEAHDGQVISLAFHPSGDLLASASWDGTLRLWDTDSGRELVRASLPEARPLRFSQDGRRLGPGRGGGNSWLWELARGEECRMLPGPDGSGAVTWPVGFIEPADLLVSVGSSGLRLEPARGGQPPRLLALPGIRDAAITPDGRTLFTSGAAGVLRWPIDRSSDGELSIGPPEPLGPLSGFPTERLRLDRAGRKLAAVVDRERGKVRLIDLAGTSPPLTLGGHPNAERVALNADGRWIATGTWHGTGVKVWDAETGELIIELPVEGSAEVVFAPGGDRLLTASSREYVFWEAGTWRPLWRVERGQSGGFPGHAAFRSDGRVMAVALTPSTLQLLDGGTGRMLATLEGSEPRNVSGLRFSPDGRVLAVAHNASRILSWDLDALGRGLEKLGLEWPLVEGTAGTVGQSPPKSRVVLHEAPWGAHLERAETLARSGLWKEAAAAIDAALAAGAPDLEAKVRRALFARALDDESAYRDTCRDVLQRRDVAGISPRAANGIAWTCAIGPGGVEDYEPAIRLARFSSDSLPEPNRLNTLGAVLYRAGRLAEAIAQFDRSVAVHGAGGTAYDAVFLSMAHCRLGHDAEARHWLSRAATPPTATFKPDAIGDNSWIPRLELELLRREAADVLGMPPG